MPKRLHRPSLLLSHADLSRITEVVQGLIDKLPKEIPRTLVSQWAAARRILPPGTPYPGKWNNTLTPYLPEIMDNLSVREAIELTIFIKASQIGATAAVENFIGYIIDMVPGPTLYATAKEDLLRKWVNKRFNPLVKYSNLEEKIFKQHALKAGRSTGNQQFSKEFPGGSLDIVSAQSEANLRMDSIRYLILDEAGAYPWNVEGFGDPIEIAIARTANWGSRKKIFIPSTAGMFGECRMWDLYKQGDQRRYFVHCIHCGGEFLFKFPSEPEMFYEGLPAVPIKWETKMGKLDNSTIRFECPHCGGVNPESAKFKLITEGKWKPTADPQRQLTRSYQIGRLYSLMDTWDRLVQIEIDAEGDHLRLQTHHNHNGGIPYLEQVQKPDIAKIYELRGHYASGEVPTDKVLFLTAAVDVQIGKKRDPNKPPRLEMEICGHGYAYKTWSLQYKVFPGKVTDPYAGAWQDLYEYVAKGGMECRRADGRILQPKLVFVDSAASQVETVVFDFCTRVHGFYPIKGAASLKKSTQGKKADQALDERGPRDWDRFREHVKFDQTFIMIYTNWYKQQLWRNLKIHRQADGDQRPHFCEFPEDYPDRYFDMLVAEEPRTDGTFWKPESRSNESQDLRVYNMAAGEYFLYLAVKAERREAIRRGVPREQAEWIKTRHIIEKWTKLMAWRRH